MLNDFFCPGPDAPDTTKPGIAPCKAAAALITGRSPNTSAILTYETAPVKSTFFLGTETDHDYIIQHLCVLRQSNLERLTIPGHFLGKIAHIGDHK